MARVALFTLFFLAAVLVLNRFLSLEIIAIYHERLSAFISQHAVLSRFGFAGLYVATVALSLPGATILTIVAGVVFGAWQGSALALVSASVGAMLVFLIARSALGDVLARKAGARIGALLDGFRQDAVSYLLFLRLVPVFPFWLVNLAPALAGVRFGTYAWTTVIGILPGTMAFAFAGAGLESLVKAQGELLATCHAAGLSPCEWRFRPSSLLTPELALAFALLGGVALIPVVWRRLATRRGM